MVRRCKSWPLVWAPGREAHSPGLLAAQLCSAEVSPGNTVRNPRGSEGPRRTGCHVVWGSCFLVPSGGELEVLGAWERVCVPDVCASSRSRPMSLCAGVGRRPGREGAARAAPLQERSRSPPSSPIANQDEAFENTALVAEVEGSLAGGTTAAGRSSHQLVLIGHISPSSGSAFLGHCLRARASRLGRRL